MSSHSPHSFDTRAFVFSLKCLVGIVILFSAVRYGTALASDVLVPDDSEDMLSTEIKIEEVKAKRKMRSQGSQEVLTKLQEYENTLATRTIGTASVETLSAAHERLIAADLSAMKLYLFENGVATSTFDILSKGKRGSRWETPTGLYKIETKEENHFSSIGEVHMPHSMQFFGNFFIHGWPFYPSGESVPEGFSGGCIRLSTDDAQKVYGFASQGTPIFVWEGEMASSTSFTVGQKPLPKISAKAFIVADIHSGEVYSERGADDVYPIASISKLLTALVANETIHYDRTLVVTRDDRKQTDGTPGTIQPDDVLSVGNMLYPLLMESNNSIAYTLARFNGTNNFMQWVNDKAKAIGMEHTSLEDPSGLSEHNVSTANDLFKLARYIHDSQSFILNISRETEKKITSETGHTYTLGNFNHFAGAPGFLGGKTGYTDAARETMVTLFEVPVDSEQAAIAIIVLQSEDRKSDVEKLLMWFKSTATVATTSSMQ
ncbi:MAG: L,D-transpeptidase family protein [Patescibacteria group bacterium]